MLLHKGSKDREAHQCLKKHNSFVFVDKILKDYKSIMYLRDFLKTLVMLYSHALHSGHPPHPQEFKLTRSHSEMKLEALHQI